MGVWRGTAGPYLHVEEMSLPNWVDVAGCVGGDRKALLGLLNAGSHVGRLVVR